MFKKIAFIAIAALFVGSISSCREDKSTMEKVADDVEDAVD